MAQNEMKAKPALPERVRSMEGLGRTGGSRDELGRHTVLDVAEQLKDLWHCCCITRAMLRLNEWDECLLCNESNEKAKSQQRIERGWRSATHGRARCWQKEDLDN